MLILYDFNKLSFQISYLASLKFNFKKFNKLNKNSIIFYLSHSKIPSFCKSKIFMTKSVKKTQSSQLFDKCTINNVTNTSHKSKNVADLSNFCQTEKKNLAIGI